LLCERQLDPDSPAYGSYGYSGANIFRGFPFYNLDLSITKAV